MWSERKHGLSTEPVPVSAYVGSSKNPKDLKDWLLATPHVGVRRFRSFEFLGTLRDHMCTAYGPEVDCVMQVDF